MLDKVLIWGIFAEGLQSDGFNYVFHHELERNLFSNSSNLNQKKFQREQAFNDRFVRGNERKFLFYLNERVSKFIRSTKISYDGKGRVTKRIWKGKQLRNHREDIKAIFSYFEILNYKPNLKIPDFKWPYFGFFQNEFSNSLRKRLTQFQFQSCMVRVQGKRYKLDIHTPTFI